MSMERTFIAIKPDGVQRGLVGEVLRRFESRGMKIVALKLMRISPKLAEEHYAEHKGKDFYDRLMRYVTSGPVVAAVIECPGAIDMVRKMVGATVPAEAAPGTIRGDFGLELPLNIVHASDSPASAEREIKLYFTPEEILSYDLDAGKWIHSFDG